MTEQEKTRTTDEQTKDGQAKAAGAESAPTGVDAPPQPATAAQPAPADQPAGAPPAGDGTDPANRPLHGM